MGYDALLAAAVAAELDSLLAGRALLEIRPLPGPDFLCLFGPRREPAWVVLSTGPLPAVYGSPGDPPEDLLALPGPAGAGPAAEQFARLLEARLAGRAAAGVAPEPWERTLVLSFRPREGLRGNRERAFLVHEAAPKPPKVILLDHDRNVAALWPPAAAAGRLETGRPYAPPPPPRPLSPSDLAARPDAFIPAAAAAPDPRDLAPALGPAAWREILRRTPVLPKGRPLPESAARALYEAFTGIAALYPEGPYAPQLIVRAAPPHLPEDVAAIAIDPGPDSTALPTPSASQAVMTWHLAGRDVLLTRELEAALARTLRTATARARRKVERQAADLTAAGRAEDLRRLGELLLANLHRVTPGSPSVAVVGHDGRTVEIPLDPRLPPARNAQRFFERYRKARSAASVEGVRRRAADELAWLEAVSYDLEAVRAGAAPPAGGTESGRGPALIVSWEAVLNAIAELRGKLRELHRLETALAAAGYAACGRQPDRKRRRDPSPDLDLQPAGGEPRRFVTDDGLTVLAGRSARQNEFLSLRLAGPDDIWLHVRGRPGSHVLLRLPPGRERTPPPASLLQAAALAAHLSPARGEAKVAVDYTRGANLRRPKGAPPGLVLYDPHETLVVDTDKISLPREIGPEGTGPPRENTSGLDRPRGGAKVPRP